MFENVSREDIIRYADEYLITSMVEGLEPVVVAEARGAKIIDVNGRGYIDAFSGISVVNVGHTRPELVEAAFEQAKKFIHVASYVYYSPPTILLAKRLAEIAPGRRLKKTFFGNSGAEAVECALKLARKYTKRHEFIALMASFHGRTLGALSVTGQWARRRFDMGPYLPGVAFAPSPYCYRCPLRQKYPECSLACALMVEDVIKYSTSNNVAAFIAEPILGEGGIIVPPPEYFRVVKEILDKHGILFIADEVQTGFARTGKMFGIEHYGVEPDIVAMAKGIAGGFPISACTTTPEIGDSFEPGDHLSTFGGNPVSAAAALVNIEIILKERLDEQARDKGEYLMKRLDELRGRHRLIGDIRGKGLMVGVELVRDEKKTPAIEEAKAVRRILRELGILVGRGGVTGSVIRIQPPLIISKEDLDRVVDALDEALRRVERGSS